MESTNKIENNWNEMKEKLKQKFILLTDSEVMFSGDTKDEMLSRLQLRLGKTREEIQEIMTTL